MMGRRANHWEGRAGPPALPAVPAAARGAERQPPPCSAAPRPTRPGPAPGGAARGDPPCGADGGGKGRGAPRSPRRGFVRGAGEAAAPAEARRGGRAAEGAGVGSCARAAARRGRAAERGSERGRAAEQGTPRRRPWVPSEGPSGRAGRQRRPRPSGSRRGGQHVALPCLSLPPRRSGLEAGAAPGECGGRAPGPAGGPRAGEGSGPGGVSAAEPLPAVPVPSPPQGGSRRCEDALRSVQRLRTVACVSRCWRVVTAPIAVRGRGPR